MDLPRTATLDFNRDLENVWSAEKDISQTTLQKWFDGNSELNLDEEIIGLGAYGYTLTVLSSEEIAETLVHDDYDEDQDLLEKWTPKFAYGR